MTKLMALAFVLLGVFALVGNAHAQTESPSPSPSPTSPSGAPNTGFGGVN